MAKIAVAKVLSLLKHAPNNMPDQIPTADHAHDFISLVDDRQLLETLPGKNIGDLVDLRLGAHCHQMTGRHNHTNGLANDLPNAFG